MADKVKKKGNVRLMNLRRGTCLCIRRETFDVGNARLVVEDVIDIFFPWKSTRMLLIADTNAFYSEVPLFNCSHKLLCYNYCEDALKLRDKYFFRHALVLGCGGGAIPRWLLSEYPSITVDAVDYSQAVIDVCREYFLNKWDDSDRLNYYCVDAQDFDQPDFQYEFIFCDLFDGENLVPFVYSQGFAKKLRSLICDDGILVINCGWMEHLDDVIKAYHPEFAYLTDIKRNPWQNDVLIGSQTPFEIKQENNV